MTRARGFTLLEMVIGLALLGMMLLLVFGALRLASKSWDAGEKRLTEAGERAQIAAFLRRTLAAIYPLQFKTVDVPPLAFQGESNRLLFAGRIPSRQGIAGVHLISLSLEGQASSGKNLVMRWLVPPPGATDFAVLDSVEPVVLMERVSDLRFAYYGAMGNQDHASWHDRWEGGRDLPEGITLRLTPMQGTEWPELVVAPRIGAGAGCDWDALHQQCADPLLQQGMQVDARRR